MYQFTLKMALLPLVALYTLHLNAQIGLPGKAKELLKENKTEKTSTPAKETPSTSTPKARPESTTKETELNNTEGKAPRTGRETALTKQPKPSGRDDKYKASEVELDFSSEPFQPAIVWATLLSESSLYFNVTNGEFKFNNLQASFLPKKTISGQEVKYESYHNVTPLLRMEVWNATANTLLQTMHYSGSLATAPFFDLELIEGYEYKTHVKLTEGAYECRFWAGTKHFYTFPFQVEKQSNPDPYAPVHDFYFLKGPWSD